MSRTLLNFWLDCLLLILFLALLWVSFVSRFLFPPGTVADGWMLWNASFDEWLQLQFILQASLALAILLHIMLHWNWVCGVLTSKILPHRKGDKHAWTDGERTLYGVGLIVVLLNLLGFAFAAAALMIQSPSV
jgi:hypothetical protein